ncbi:hypothetical protein FHG87_005624 [Trinorchestia longiramus]|nr:hypothetical protein FHG87_005624 [Trinorchestia longiramus]
MASPSRLSPPEDTSGKTTQNTSNYQNLNPTGAQTSGITNSTSTPRHQSTSRTQVPSNSDSQNSTTSGNKTSNFASSSKTGEEKQHLLAVVFSTGQIYLIRAHDDVSPIVLDTGLMGIHAEWSNSAELLATAGHWPGGDKARGSSGSVGSPLSGASTSSSSCATQSNQSGSNSSSTNKNTNSNNTSPNNTNPNNTNNSGSANNSQTYHNVIRFYTRSGTLRYTYSLPACQHSVSALTWGHNDKRLFIAAGPQLFIGRVSRRVASLQLLCRRVWVVCVSIAMRS